MNMIYRPLRQPRNGDRCIRSTQKAFVVQLTRVDMDGIRRPAHSGGRQPTTRPIELARKSLGAMHCRHPRNSVRRLARYDPRIGDGVRGVRPGVCVGQTLAQGSRPFAEHVNELRTLAHPSNRPPLQSARKGPLTAMHGKRCYRPARRPRPVQLPGHMARAGQGEANRRRAFSTSGPARPAGSAASLGSGRRPRPPPSSAAAAPSAVKPADFCVFQCSFAARITASSAGSCCF